MNTQELLHALDDLDSQNVWLFTPNMLGGVFTEESSKTLLASLDRHVKSGILKKVKKGLYANPRAKSTPPRKLEALVPYLRPRAINYVSQESRLSELGVISQIPVEHLTLMTTGRSQTFNTAYGTIEFTHTNRRPKAILEETVLDENTGLLQATPERALRDLKRSGRNIDLVNSEIYHELTDRSIIMEEV
tara:strand:+ start:46 stop:615 length:570 start_codon:yes stop_codon:yes gene_type:complete